MKQFLFLSILSLLLLSTVNTVQSQTFNMGVVWERDNFTTSTSSIGNITKQTDGTYLGCGYVYQNNKRVGFIVHFNESGKTLGTYVLTPPSNAPEWATGTPTSTLKHAYLTNDGAILAFGTIENAGAPANLKGRDINGTNGQLRNGLWVTKVNQSDKSVLLNRLDRNNSFLNNSYRIDPNKIMLTGFDYDASNSGNDTFLRVYDMNGDWTYDNYSTPNAKRVNIPWTAAIKDYSPTSYAITGRDGIYEIRKSDYSMVSPTPFITGYNVNNGTGGDQGCIPIVHNMGIPHPLFGEKKGGFWVVSRIGYTVAPGQPNKYFGVVFYEKDNANILKECKVLSKQDVNINNVNYSLPLQLPGSDKYYVGTKSNYGKNQIYICEDDINRGFIIHDFPDTYKYNTVLNIASITDGFFSCGSNNGHAAIVKYSTCSDFKCTNATDIYAPYSKKNNSTTQISYTKELKYIGSLGDNSSTDKTVQCSLVGKVLQGSVDGFSAGDVIHNVPMQTVESHKINTITNKYEGTAITLNKTFNAVSLDAIIEYRFTIRDQYYTGGVSQNCVQTYTFYVIPYGITPLFQEDCSDALDPLNCDLTSSSQSYTYQWQISKDGINWIDISGATSSIYNPQGQKRGLTYYRVVFNEGNLSIESPIIKVKVNSCVLPVNHNISAMDYQ